MSTESSIPPAGPAPSAPRRQRVRPFRADVRDGVLAAGREAFRDLGYHGASLDAIARRAGFSKGAVYSNFDSKESLFLECMASEIQELAQHRRDTTSHADADAYFRSLAQWLLTLAGDGRGQRAFSEFAAYAARDAALAARLAEVRQPLTDRTVHAIVAAAQDQGRELAVPARDAAAFLLSLANGLSLEQIGHEDPVMSLDGLAAVLRGLYV